MSIPLIIVMKGELNEKDANLLHFNWEKLKIVISENDFVLKLAQNMGFHAPISYNR